MSGPRGSIAA